MKRLSHIAVVFWLSLCFFSSLAFAESGTVAQIQSAALTSDDEGLTVKLIVSAPPAHSCDELEVLVRLSRQESDAGSLLKEFASLDSQWQRIALEDGEEEDVVVGMTELSPVRPTQDVLLQQRGEELYIRYRSARTVEAGTEQTLSIGPLAYADDNKENPLKASAVAVGHVVSPLTNGDMERFVQSGSLATLVLLRTIGLEGPESTRAVRAEEFAENDTYVEALKRSIESVLIAGESGDSLTTAVRLRVLALVDPDAFVRMVVPLLKSPKLPAASKSLSKVLNGIRDTDPFGWEALAFVLPDEDTGAPMTSVLGAAVDSLSPQHVAQLMERIDVLEKTSSGQGLHFANSAGGAWLRGMGKWADEELNAVLDRMERWRVSTVVLGFFTEERWKDWSARATREQRLARAVTLTKHDMPMELVRFIGDDDAEWRRFAYDVVVASGESANKAVLLELTRLGYAEDKAKKLEPQKAAAILQGLYLAPLGAPYVDEAQRVLSLRTLGKQGSCYDPLLRGRLEVHPELAYPPVLWARCRAEGAHELLQSGRVDRALALIEQALSDAPNDPEVSRWLRPIQLGKLRQLVGEGKNADAQAFAKELDPNGEHREIQSMLAQLSAVDVPVQVRSERLSLLLVIFSSFLMLLGCFGFMGRAWTIRRSMAFVRTLSEDEPREFSGIGRQILVTDHALSIRRGLGYRLIPWAETRAVCRVPVAPGRREGLMFWFASGDGFYMSTSGLKDANELLALIGRYLEQSGVAIQELEVDDAELTAENEYLLELLTKRNRTRVVGQTLAIAVGVLGTLAAAFVDTGQDTISLAHWVQAVGIGLGGGLAVWVAVDILVPMSRG